LKKKTDFVAAPRVGVIVLDVLALPYALAEAGLEAKKIVLLMYLVLLTVFSAYLLVFWIGRYRHTSHRINVIREEIELNRRSLEFVLTRMSETNQKEHGKQRWA
jgi:hypothetical protein